MPSPAIRMICPNLRCRTVLSVPPTARGKSVRCRQCGSRIQVPDKRKPTGPATPIADEAKAQDSA